MGRNGQEWAAMGEKGRLILARRGNEEVGASAWSSDDDPPPGALGRVCENPPRKGALTTLFFGRLSGGENVRGIPQFDRLSGGQEARRARLGAGSAECLRFLGFLGFLGFPRFLRFG
ncbi:unnamed protein product [Pylaiella littoralis]